MSTQSSLKMASPRLPQLPLHSRDARDFWNLIPKDQIKSLEIFSRLDFLNWPRPRPVVCIGHNEKFFSIFFEKVMWKCPTIIGVFDPLHTGPETTPYFSFHARHVPNHDLQYFRIFRAVWELKQLKKAYKDLLVVDFSQIGPATFLRTHLEEEGFEVVDFTFYEMVENLHSVYEPWHDYRAKTKDNFDRFIQLHEELEDPISKETLLAHLGFVFTGDRTFLRHNAFPLDRNYRSFRPEGFSNEDIIVDAGAANGDTVIDFLKDAKNGSPRFVCYEPDPGNFRQLKILQQRLQSIKMNVYQAALGERAGEIDFSAGEGNSSHAAKAGGAVSTKKVRVVSLDETVEKCTFIKMDIEGAEPAALRGAQKLFANNRPEAAICIYHNALDPLECTDIIRAMKLNYKFNMRRYCPYIYEFVLYANPL